MRREWAEPEIVARMKRRGRKGKMGQRKGSGWKFRARGL